MDGLSSPEPLRTVLQHELDHLASLSALLQREYLALTSQDSAILEAIIKEKQNCLRLLEKVGKERERLLQNRGISLTTADIDSLTEEGTSAQRSELRELWQSLQTLAKQLHYQNQVNGSIIKMRHHLTERALGILQGRGPEMELYDLRAKTNPITRLRSLARA